MGITSKEIMIIIIEVIIGIVITLSLKNLNFDINKLKDSIITISIIIISAFVIILIIYKKINEVNDELKQIKSKQEDLEEKLKRAEDLINIRFEIKELQKRVFKNGKK